jgi:hypothetical protein
MSWTTRIAAICFALSLTACSTRGREESSTAGASVVQRTQVQNVVSSGVAAKNVGDPCTGSDGWQAREFGAPVAEAGPVAYAVPQDAGVLDRALLPPGVGYCIVAGDMYPNGYFSMNCSVDADCPSAAACNGSACVKTCTDDSQCPSPTVCNHLPTRHCSVWPPPRY